MRSLNKVGTALTAVFVVVLVALIAEILYVLWSRRAFRRRNSAVHGGDPSDNSSDTFTTSSKELLYFLCWKNQTRIEPDGAPIRASDRPSPNAPPEVIDVFKLQGMYGPSRVLFTIKEEEREELESEKSLSSAEKGHKKTKRVSLEECLSELTSDPPEVEVEVEVEIDVDRHATPFSTPCGSPLFYTPSNSPSREEESGDGNLTESPENNRSMDSGVSADKTVSFVCLEVDDH